MTPIDPANVPVSPISANLLSALMPAPNYGAAGSYANNYQINFPSPISANQGDVRLDQSISQQQSVFARFSYKNRQVITAPSAACTFTYCAEAGSPLQGGYNTPEIDEGLTFAHNFVFSTNLLNEFRGGFNAQHTSETQSYSDHHAAHPDRARPFRSRTRPGPKRRRCSSTDSCPPARATPACSAARSSRRSTT